MKKIKFQTKVFFALLLALPLLGAAANTRVVEHPIDNSITEKRIPAAEEGVWQINTTSYPNLKTALASAVDDDVIKLSGDLVRDFTGEGQDFSMSCTKKVTIDLNGYTYKTKNTTTGGQPYIVITGALTFTDTSEAKTGVWTHDDSDGHDAFYAFYLWENATLNIDGGSIENYNNPIIYRGDNGKVNISSGRVFSPSMVYSADNGGNYNLSGCELNISGGEFKYNSVFGGIYSGITVSLSGSPTFTAENSKPILFNLDNSQGANPIKIVGEYTGTQLRIAFSSVAEDLEAMVFDDSLTPNLDCCYLCYTAYEFKIDGQKIITKKKPVAVVSSVTITTEASEVTVGESLEFNATVTGSGPFTQNVSWTVINAYSADTKFEGNVLKVAEDETAEEVIVIATSSDKASVKAQKTITIKQKALPPAPIENSNNGLIVALVIISIIVLLLIVYVCGYFFLYRKHKLDDSWLAKIYAFLPKEK